MMKSSSPETYNLPQIFKAVFARLPKPQHKQFWLLLITMIIVAVFEAISLGIVALFASAVTDPVTAMESGYVLWAKNIFSWSFLYNPRHFIIFLGLVVMVVIPCKNIARGTVAYGISRYSAFIEAYFGEKLLNGFLSKNYQWLLDKNTADLVLGVQWRVYLGRQFILLSLNTLSDIVIVVFLMVALFIVNPIVSLCVLLIVGGTAYFIYFKMRIYIDSVAKKCANIIQKINRDCTKAIHGVKDVKISGTKFFFVDEFRSDAFPYAKYLAFQDFLKQAPVLTLESIGFMMLACVVCVMLILMNDSLAAVTGTLTLLAVTAWRVLPAINRIVNNSTVFRNSLPYITIVLDYLKQIESEIYQEDKQAINNTIVFEKKIELENIQFSYLGGNTPVIKNLSLCIEKGETIGIVGFSGAGKSTVADLLIGLLTPDKGSIAVDGKKITRSDMDAWVRHIGYVSQSPYIFDGTLAENVAFGIPVNQIDKTKVEKCCKMSAMDFLSDLTDGIDAYIGERGVRLSGGQQQRVAIARALYRNPDVLVFDEATSALDFKSEKAILKTIYGFKGKQTMIIIAHRLSTVEKCDRIAWLDKGALRDVDIPERILKDYKQEMKIVAD